MTRSLSIHDQAWFAWLVPFAVAATSARAQNCNDWVNRTPSMPSPDVGLGSSAFDSSRGVTVLFTANDAPGTSGSTWEWDGSSWMLRSTTGPEFRYGGAMAYDSQRHVCVLFGGRRPGNTAPFVYFGETWEWDGINWTIRSNSGPSGREQHGMCYDSDRAVTVLYGGLNFVSTLRDTWQWDGNTWVLRENGSPNTYAIVCLCYDSQRQRTVLFDQTVHQTWEWDGLAWASRTTTGPPVLGGGKMAFDAARQVSVLVGEASSDFKTWEWDGNSWLQRLAIGPYRSK